MYTKGNFEQNLKKGAIGETIVREYYESLGWIVYFPFTKDKPHWIDMLAMYQKEKVIALDIKTKDCYRKYNANGVNKKCYNEYLNFIKTSNVPFYLVFVDRNTRSIYSINLKDTLAMKPTFEDDEKIAWPLVVMEHIRYLTDDELAKLNTEDIQPQLFNGYNNTYVGQP